MFSTTLHLDCLDFLNNREGIIYLHSLRMTLMFKVKLQNHLSKIIVNGVKVTFRHIQDLCKCAHHFKCWAMYSSFILRHAGTRSFFLNACKDT
ncbi:hypothetical protein PEC301875_25040 [Pectobacterium carotovorum subsp. carotovorum]|nr:hypothetical protein PEC301875_25040 [Pectobacterium carotovorum subsp. carotovorum]